VPVVVVELSVSCCLRPNQRPPIALVTEHCATLAVGYALPGSDPVGAHSCTLVPKC